jgi:hypothetical protein
MIREINVMSHIYKNAILTIIAGAARSADEGFLRTPECRAPLTLKSGYVLSVSITLGDESTMHRAWTFQEELLSSRALYFGTRRGVRFNCQRGSQFYNGETFQYSNTLDFPVRLPPNVFKMGKSKRSLSKLWVDIVKEYSQRRLTHADDRLPALAGIASEIYQIQSDKYLAGIWQRFLVRHLGWRAIVVRPGREFPKMSMQVISSPSWSWISLLDKNCNDTVIDTDEVVRESAKIVDYELELEDKDATFGRIKSGRITLRAKLLAFSKPLLSMLMRRRRYNSDWGMETYYETGATPESIQFQYPLLGFTAKKSAVGLVLAERADKTFWRIGWFKLSPMAIRDYSLNLANPSLQLIVIV